MKGFDKMDDKNIILKSLNNLKNEMNNASGGLFERLKNIEIENENLQQKNNNLEQVLDENNKLKIQISARETLCEEYEQLISTILNFSFFKEECPLNFGFEDNSKEDKAQNIFYNDEYCENNCNDNYKDCWLKYFKELQKAKGDVKNENVEIIEEPKKIKKIEMCTSGIMGFDGVENITTELKNKINELIDEINNLKEE